jgi:HAD superfamily hydrolase (TIGR01509 family)
MTVHALIFDVDGTLADTEELHRQAFNAAFAEAGLPWHWSRPRYRALLRITGGKERLAHHIGSLRLGSGEQQRLLDLVPTLHANKTRHYAAAVEAGRLPLRDGVQRLLHEARDDGCRLAIASTTSAANIDALLRATLGPDAIDWFDVIACSDQVARKKPAPDIYQLVLQLLGVEPEAAVAFEDSAHGLAAAQAAGVWTVATPTWWSAEDDLHEAGLLLPRLGDPQQPLPGEPGGVLQHAPWLTMAELQARRSLRPPPDAVQALYREAR